MDMSVLMLQGIDNRFWTQYLVTKSIWRSMRGEYGTDTTDIGIHRKGNNPYNA
jgi:hypothetical protein